MKKKGTRRCLHQDTMSLPTPTSLLQQHTYFHAGNWMMSKVVLFALPDAFMNKQTNNMLKQNKDVGMGL